MSIEVAKEFLSKSHQLHGVGEYCSCVGCVKRLSSVIDSYIKSQTDAFEQTCMSKIQDLRALVEDQETKIHNLESEVVVKDALASNLAKDVVFRDELIVRRDGHINELEELVEVLCVKGHLSIHKNQDGQLEIIASV